jgi:glycosyltransferase involved in cell wall biosynthesis
MNTELTLEKSMRSVLSQLDENFEVVIVDESSDGSRNILRKLAMEYPIIRNVFLSRNNRRSIGDARNISIENANGEYCIMHIDCDDFWYPFISDFVKVFESLENKLGEDFLLAGHQINMAKKDFLIKHGPYRKVEHGEDRDLWMRLAKLGLYQPIDHVPFFYRMDVGVRRTKKKAFLRTYWSVRDEIRGGIKFSIYVKQIFDSSHVSGLKTKVLRVGLFPFAYLSSRQREKLPTDGFFTTVNEWNEYKERTFGLYAEIIDRVDSEGNLDFLSRPGRWIFSNRRSEIKLDEMPSELRRQAGIIK